MAAAGAGHAVPVAGSPRTGDGKDACDAASLLLPGFEGPEKVLEVGFSGPGMRSVTRAQWDDILGAAKCSILCTQSNAVFDSYVLSESSLFVYDNKVALMTCGTTSLLLALQPLLKAAEAVGVSMTWVQYSRPSLLFPDAQPFPHVSMHDEMDFLKGFVPEPEFLVLGPLSADHHIVITGGPRPKEMAMNIMMYGLDAGVAKLFHVCDEYKEHRDATLTSNIHTLLPDDATIQEYLFEPCGYSMNAMLDDTYWTVHITPEPEFSYASFRTNAHLDAAGCTELLRRVVELFKPDRFCVAVPNSDVTFAPSLGVKTAAYARTASAHAVAHHSRTFALANYELEQQTDAGRPSGGVDAVAGGRVGDSATEL